MIDYEEIVNRRVAQLIETLSARKSVDLARLFGRFTCVKISLSADVLTNAVNRHDVMNDIAFVVIIQVGARALTLDHLLPL